MCGCEHDFHWQSALDVRKKLQGLDGALGINPPQLVGIGKVKAGHSVLRNRVMRPDEEVKPQREKERPGRHQSMCLLQGGGPLEKGMPEIQKGM